MTEIKFSNGEKIMVFAKLMLEYLETNIGPEYKCRPGSVELLSNLVKARLEELDKGNEDDPGMKVIIILNMLRVHSGHFIEVLPEEIKTIINLYSIALIEAYEGKSK